MECDKASTKILTKYSNYANILLFNLAIELPKNMEINKYTIKLIDNKQSLYWPIYILNLVKLETLKTYIETYLRQRFTQPSKSLISILITGQILVLAFVLIIETSTT